MGVDPAKLLVIKPDNGEQALEISEQKNDALWVIASDWKERPLEELAAMSELWSPCAVTERLDDPTGTIVLEKQSCTRCGAGGTLEGEPPAGPVACLMCGKGVLEVEGSWVT